MNKNIIQAPKAARHIANACDARVVGLCNVFPICLPAKTAVIFFFNSRYSNTFILYCCYPNIILLRNNEPGAVHQLPEFLGQTTCAHTV